MLKKLKQKLKREHLTNDEYRERKAKRKLHIIYFLIICNITIIANSYVMYSKWSDHYKELLMMSTSGMVRVVGAEASDVATVSTISDEEYTWTDAYAEMARNNINPVKAQCLVKHESSENCNAYYVNGPGSIDMGCFQWSSKYQIDTGYIDMECIGDLRCETKKFIEKVKHDQNFEAWHGYTKHCQWLGTNPFN